MKKLYTSTIIASLLSFLILCSCTSNKRPLTTAQIFGDQMVLQANKPINIWGTFTPNATITVLFRSQSLSIKADKNGKWKASLQPENYGTDERLIIKTKTDTLIFNDISVGEVWLCSGQLGSGKQFSR
jgi:sialate O-acetylesterase